MMTPTVQCLGAGVWRYRWRACHDTIIRHNTWSHVSCQTSSLITIHPSLNTQPPVTISHNEQHETEHRVMTRELTSSWEDWPVQLAAFLRVTYLGITWSCSPPPRPRPPLRAVLLSAAMMWWPVTPVRRQSQEAIHYTSHYCQSPLFMGILAHSFEIISGIIKLRYKPMGAGSCDERMTGVCQDVRRCHNRQPTTSHETGTVEQRHTLHLLPHKHDRDSHCTSCLKNMTHTAPQPHKHDRDTHCTSCLINMTDQTQAIPSLKPISLDSWKFLASDLFMFKPSWLDKSSQHIHISSSMHGYHCHHLSASVAVKVYVCLLSLDLTFKQQTNETRVSPLSFIIEVVFW